MGIPRESSIPDVVWAPQDGPQTALLTCPIFEVAFGGARGGGKTDGCLGDWIKHSFDAGRFAAGMMIRRHLTELEETIARSHEVFGPMGARFHTQSKTWTMPWKARLKFRFIERDTDAMLYQGHSYCAGVGTLIVMADGTRAAIEDVVAGDWVATLEGPRRVTGTTAPYLAPCVSALVRGASGEVLGEQVHPTWHPVLASAEWIWSRMFRKPRISLPPLPATGDQRRPASARPPCADSALPGWVAYSAAPRTSYTGWQQRPPALPPPPARTFQVTLHERTARLAGEHCHGGRMVSSECRSPDRLTAPAPGLSRGRPRQWLGLALQRALSQSVLGRCAHGLPSGLACAATGSPTGEGYPGGCRDGHGSCDERAHGLSKNAREIPRQPSGAGSRRRWSLWGALGTILERSLRPLRRTAHPYTGEARRLSEGVTTGTMECREIGLSWVADLCVEGANHYITDTGLVNKNSRIYVEEAGNFPRFEPIQKLFGATRSAHGVRTGMRLTANPGGPGHQWFKGRYISPAPLGYKVLTDTLPSGRTIDRIFIPSKLQDNKILTRSDPGYEDRLHMVGSPELVRAWLLGDWDIVAGAFFQHWSPKLLIPAFTPPRDWPRFMSMDWGSAKPFSVHWWAVADGSPITVGKRVLWLPRGALVAYREWYGMKPGQPNVGLKLTAEELADGIMKREAAAGEYPEGHNTSKTHIRYRVADPSCWKEEGGPSIAERMARHRPEWDKSRAFEGVYMRPADNSRIGGWDQMSSRMRGFDEAPMIYFMESCVDALRTIPTLQHDEIKFEDLDTEAEDHAADDVRYACMSRPMPKEAPPIRSKPSPFVFDEVVKNG